MKITKCNECSLFHNLVNDKISQVCTFGGKTRMLNTSLDIPDIPDWCPLKDEIENIDDEKFIVVNGNKIPSKTTGDKSITDPLTNKDKQEEEIMNTVLKDLHKCNENVSGIWKLVSDNELGDRNNKGKLRWSLVDMKTLEGLVKVLMMGAEKYSDFNWQKGLPINEVYESLMRHLVSFMDGEDNDTESGLSHLDHALCNIYFMKWFMDNKPEMDNRRKKKVEIKEQDFVEPKYPDENEK